MSNHKLKQPIEPLLDRKYAIYGGSKPFRKIMADTTLRYVDRQELLSKAYGKISYSTASYWMVSPRMDSLSVPRDNTDAEVIEGG